eukprot:gnl/TRDRNA2_/TRDRNA2_36667_c0_seq1.p1 gnl/TRDRNA2_/TRDRNA2_36667_c0~~gnl/TRDRNA2_/TRDRNA2_36667_c0_seq1.p1  ORF type:complete len:111 (-),score=26.06 gnl/TRDRNA2_/TRDRNA2_36667_c0_seq1:69-401(-)
MAFHKIMTIFTLFTVALGDVPSTSHMLEQPQEHDVRVRRKAVQHFLAEHNEQVAVAYGHGTEIHKWQADQDAKRLLKAQNAMAAADATMQSATDELQRGADDLKKFRARK